MQPFENTENRSFDYKKGLNAEDARRKRETGLLDLRRANRDKMLMNRRQKKAPLVGQNVEETETNESEIKNIPFLYKSIMSDNTEMQYKATLSLRKIISNKKNPPINEVIQSGALPRLIQFLSRTDNQNIVFETAWILTNVASGTSENTKALLECNAIPSLVQLLNSPNIEIAEQVCWALSNIAGESSQYRDMVLDAGAMEPVLNLLFRSKKDSVMRTCAWTLSNFCRSKPPPDFKYMKRILPFIKDLFCVDDMEVVADAAWALSFICDENTRDNHKIQAVVDSGIVPRALSLLKDREQPKAVRTPVLRIIGNIVTGNDIQTQQVIDNGLLEVLNVLLDASANRLHKEVVWTCSNIAAGCAEQMDLLAQSGIVRKLIANFPMQNYEVKKETAWVLANLVAHNDVRHAKYIVENNGLECLTELLLTNEPQTVKVALEGISNILKVGAKIAEQEGKNNEWADLFEGNGGLDRLEQLQDTEDEYIYNKAVEIITTHFGGDEESDLAEIRPEEKQSSFNFGVFGSGEGEFKF